MRAFWPAVEAAQTDYESLRRAALSGVSPSTPTWLRFQRHGLIALITTPELIDSTFSADVVGVSRPPWSPHSDPRLEVLAAGYEFVLAGAPRANGHLEVQ
jgi:hypothetical protein